MLAGAPKPPAPSPNKIDTSFEPWFAVARSCLPSPLKSPTATELVKVPAPKFAAEAKLIGLHVAGVVTVNVNVAVLDAPAPSKAINVTVYTPAGCASVTRTTPVVGSPSSLPLKFVEVETVRLVAPVGAAEGVMVVFAPSCTDVFA